MQDLDFFTWRRDMMYRFQGITTTDEVYRTLQQQTQLLEFEFYSLCVRHPVPFTRPKISLQTNYPQSWIAHYQSENYFAIDPVLKADNFIQGHLPWSDQLFSDAPVLWEAARDHGLRKGFTQCLMLPNHALGFFSVSGNSVGTRMQFSHDIDLRLQTLLQLSMMTLLRLEDEMVMPPEMRFSKRELEILKWTAEGKTSAMRRQ